MKIYLCNCFLLFFILCVEVSVSIITLPLVINKYFLPGINICIGNSPICNTVKISSHERFSLKILNLNIQKIHLELMQGISD